ncbi:MAG: peptide ABC transporter substrate-binding protein [Lachnospiraceae bacterium]|nr:peptide ABC transporter substrate-binding protein [Lachnospiraceae bacterium]
MRVCLVAGCMLALTACGSTSTEQTTTSNDSEVVQSTVVEEEKVAKADSAEETDKIVIVDQLGKTIEFDGVPQRVATTIMPFPYIYYAVVGNNDNLIGCNPSSIVAYENSALKYMYPELANANTSFVDTSFVVNVEEVLKLEPDVVFQWNYMDEEIAKMEAAGIKVVALEYGDVEDLETWIRMIGTMFDKEERAEELITYFHESVAEVTDKIATLPEEEISNILIMSDNLKVTGTGFSKYWIENSGAVNPAGDLSGEALYVNMEQIYEWNPSIVYIGNFTDLQPSDLMNNELEGQDWSVVDAVQNGQVYKIPIGGYRWDPPGVETPLMVKWLAKIQHPELFEDMDMREEVTEFYKDVYNFDITEEILDEILGDVQDF